MIGKGKAIAHTRASMDYGWNQEKNAEVVFSQHLAGNDANQVTEEFKLIQEENLRCQKNTLSFVLSPTPKDGKNLTKEQLGELTQRFIKEMDLKERQAIAFVHRDKDHTHVHLYVNRIDFDGKAYKDNFIGKRSQQAAEKVAQDMGLTTVKEVQQRKKMEFTPIRQEIKNVHERVMEHRPKTLDAYIKAMKAENVQVIPCINKANKLQGFRFEYKAYNLKASEVHRSMSGGKIMGQLAQNNKVIGQLIQLKNTTQVLGKTIELSPNLAASIAKSIVKKVIKRSIDQGIGI